MIEEVVEMVEEVLKQDKLFELGAKIYKKSVDALIEQGFTRDEAMRIIIAQGPPIKASK